MRRERVGVDLPVDGVVVDEAHPFANRDSQLLRADTAPVIVIVGPDGDGDGLAGCHRCHTRR